AVAPRQRAGHQRQDEAQQHTQRVSTGHGGPSSGGESESGSQQARPPRIVRTKAAGGTDHLWPAERGRDNLQRHELGGIVMLLVGRHRTRTCQGITRRALLQVGASTVLGLSLADLLRRRDARGASPSPVRSVLLLWLWGGPAQLDTWDPKPAAPL